MTKENNDVDLFGTILCWDTMFCQELLKLSVVYLM